MYAVPCKRFEAVFLRVVVILMVYVCVYLCIYKYDGWLVYHIYIYIYIYI